MRGGIGPSPAYSLRSRSRAVLRCSDSSDELLVELNVGETTRDSRAPRRFPSMTCSRQHSSNRCAAHGYAYIEALLCISQDDLSTSTQSCRRVRIITLVTPAAVSVQPSVAVHDRAAHVVARKLVTLLLLLQSQAAVLKRVVAVEPWPVLEIFAKHTGGVAGSALVLRLPALRRRATHAILNGGRRRQKVITGRRMSRRRA
jgi:hypothetical protein